jgi:hypothetical protein
MGPAITDVIEKFYDNSLENIGRGNSVSITFTLPELCCCSGLTVLVLYIRTGADRSVDLPRTHVGSSGYCSFPDVQR